MEEIFKSLSESVSEQCYDEIMGLVEEIINGGEESTPSKKPRKNNKAKVYRRMDNPEKNKINVKKYYNRVIHNDTGSENDDYVKIKGEKFYVDKYGQIGGPYGQSGAHSPYYP